MIFLVHISQEHFSGWILFGVQMFSVPLLQTLRFMGKSLHGFLPNRTLHTLPIDAGGEIFPQRGLIFIYHARSIRFPRETSDGWFCLLLLNHKQMFISHALPLTSGQWERGWQIAQIRKVTHFSLCDYSLPIFLVHLVGMHVKYTIESKPLQW